MPPRADAIANLYRVTWADRLAARLSGPMRRRVALSVDPAWAVLGDPERGRALLAGRFGLGEAVAQPGRSIWDITADMPAAEATRQSFAFLDDLAAVASPAAQRAAALWVGQWLTRQGNGRGPGWRPALAAARLERLTRHQTWLTSRSDGLGRGRIERALARHQRFALRRLSAVSGGADGAICLARLVAAGAVLSDGRELQSRAQDALEPLLPRLIGSDGAVDDRCPETLARVFSALAFAARGLDLAGQQILPEHRAALDRMAGPLRALRLGDGTLARFHGGGAGSPAGLDAALAAAGVRSGLVPAHPMGFARLARGRSLVIADLAPPPVGVPGSDAHASTLAFEFCVGSHPLIVNCGSGAAFGPDWHNAARKSASHSTVIVDQESSARFADTGAALDGPGDVQADLHLDRPDAHVVGAHNGYAAGCGVIHVRRLDLDAAGDHLRGEDLLSALTTGEKSRFRQAGGPQGVPFVLRFHLHPDVDAHLDAALGTVHLALPGGGHWLFRHQGGVSLRLDASVYLDNTRAEPRACRQIVLEGRARDYATTVRWSLGREAGTPSFPRDVVRGEAPDDTRPGQV
ncbi:MAG: heparinase II/III family protein [Rhodobacteraceae bacterium]|nr:heparinase II/III family protein [Paracoccaceae bacterium]